MEPKSFYSKIDVNEMWQILVGIYKYLFYYFLNMRLDSTFSVKSFN